MDTGRTCLCLFILFTFITLNQCGRYGGGRSGGGRIGGSRGGSSGHSRSPAPSHTFSHPSPARQPSHSYPSPPSYNPSHNPYGSSYGGFSQPSYNPSHNPYGSSYGGFSQPSNKPSPTVRRPGTIHYPPSGPTHRPSSNPVTPRRSNPAPSTPRSQPTPPPISRVTVNPSNQGVTPHRPGPTPPPYHSGGFTTRRGGLGSTRRPITPTRAYGTGTATVRSAGWDLPPRPSRYSPVGSGYPRGPQGPPSTGYHSPQHTYTPYQGPSKVKIVNKYNYHYPGYYSLPVQSSYPGYYHSPSYYHYSSHDTGSTALGFFMGYGLARLTTPTYSHYSFYNGYTPRYDHYTVHHYYHNRDSVPPRQEIPANAIVGCVGDSSTVCPSNTISLCTSQGALMCVVSATSTVPCADNRQVNCVKSTIPCINNTAPECKNADQGKVSIDIPCVSTAEVQGNIKYVDNTIIAEIPANATLTNATLTNATLTNDTLTTTTTPKYSTKYPITTTPVPETASNSTVQKRSTVPQNFCVTVLALPAEKKETEGEKMYDDAKEIASRFLESVWGP